MGLDGGRQRHRNDTESDRRDPEALVSERLRAQQRFHPCDDPEPVEGRNRSRCLGPPERDLGQRQGNAFAVTARGVDRLFVRPTLQCEPEPPPQPLERRHQRRCQLGRQQVAIMTVAGMTPLVCQDDREFVTIEGFDEPGGHGDPPPWPRQRVHEPIIAVHQSEGACLGAAMTSPRAHRPGEPNRSESE